MLFDGKVIAFFFRLIPTWKTTSVPQFVEEKFHYLECFNYVSKKSDFFQRGSGTRPCGKCMTNIGNWAILPK